MPPLCPVSTLVPPSYYSCGPEETEVRAYKLGKRRWSYNEVEIVLRQAGSERRLTVLQAVNQGTDTFSEECRESSVNYRLDLANHTSIMLHGFLCYDVRPQGCGLPTPAPGAPPQYQRWYLVQRAACCKGCTGPVVRVIQRFGKVGKRARGGGPPSPDDSPLKLSAGRTGSNLKDPRFLYLSFDEAGTHVGAKTFRLILAAYDASGRRLLSTAASAPIRVLANNDVPTGAAHIRLEIEVPADWEGWSQPDDDLVLEDPLGREVKLVAPRGEDLQTPRAAARALAAHERGAALGADDGPAWADGLAAHYPGAGGAPLAAGEHADDGEGMLMLGGAAHNGGYGGRLLRLGHEAEARGGATLLSQASDVALRRDGLRQQLEDYASVLAPLVVGGDNDAAAATLAQAVLAAQQEFDFVSTAGGLLRSGSGISGCGPDEGGAPPSLLRGFGSHGDEPSASAATHLAAPSQAPSGGGAPPAQRGLSKAALWSLTLGAGGPDALRQLGGAEGGHEEARFGGESLEGAAGELESFATAVLCGVRGGEGADRARGAAPREVTRALEYLQRVTGVNFGGEGAPGPFADGAEAYEGALARSVRRDFLGPAADLLSSIATHATQSPASADATPAGDACAGLLFGLGHEDEGHPPGVFGAPWAHGAGADRGAPLGDGFGVHEASPHAGAHGAFHHGAAHHEPRLAPFTKYM